MLWGRFWVEGNEVIEGVRSQCGGRVINLEVFIEIVQLGVGEEFSFSSSNSDREQMN